MTGLVYAAEAGAVLWLVFFTAILVEQRRASVGLPDMRLDRIGRSLVGGAKWGLIMGLGLWFLYSAIATADHALGIGLGLLI